MDRWSRGLKAGIGTAVLVLVLVLVLGVAGSPLWTPSPKPSLALTAEPTKPPLPSGTGTGAADLGIATSAAQGTTLPSPRPSVMPPQSSPVISLSPANADGLWVQLPEGDDSQPLSIDVVTLDGGSVVVSSARWGQPALRFPAFSTSPSPPRAIMRVTSHPGAESDPLAPGVSGFTFGADFAVDAQSEGTTVDGGNNLIQRGLASDPSQYKIDVDDNLPACRIQGPKGVVELRLTERIIPDVRYRARCTRLEDTVQFVVEVVEDASTRVLETVTAQVPTGDLQWTRSTPLSVGGKLSARGEVIRSATDQFNGLIRHPILALDDYTVRSVWRDSPR